MALASYYGSPNTNPGYIPSTGGGGTYGGSYGGGFGGGFGVSGLPRGSAAGTATSNPNVISPSQALMNQYQLYNQGVQQSQDLFKQLQSGFTDLASPGPTYTPSTYNYTPSASLTGAISNLQDLSKTGGYSAQDIADLRARGISPIRSIYSSAQQNIDRAKALQGGYSPNYTAATAKLARDESQQIADATQNVNAQLAQAIAGNKLAVAPELASAAAGESAQAAAYGSRAADVSNAAQQFNIQDALNRRMQSLEGLRSLYGTTPALASLFGQQAADAARLYQTGQASTIGAGSNLARLVAGGIGR